ncbi:hypothetical protein ['Paenibacillus yunnanensis' Narsing Rao et al. 2020]|uniref:hypothetical protein n=1 Tax=Paenibacillus tengchongensis TaxID=2608684 RepID=UPI0016523729|nr:hypothetical protein [Paenibacillus tengchongensis]
MLIIFLLLIIFIGILAIEGGIRKKLKNDEAIIARLDLIINELQKTSRDQH